MGIPSWKRKMTYGMILSEATVYAVAFFVERGFSWHEKAENINTGEFQLQIEKNPVLSKIRNSLSNAGAISTKFLYRITISIMVLVANNSTALRFKK